MILDVFRTEEPVPYRLAYQRQKELHALRAAGAIPDTLWLLEHPPVFTTGMRGNQENNILANPAQIGAELVETERGGEVTYHGPGQLVGYLFVSMENHGFKVKKFVHSLEEAFIDLLARRGISARHDTAHTGVWVGMDKITAIGIALRQKVTFHGFAFNINTNLNHFNLIVPCGIAEPGRGVTSLERLEGRKARFARTAEDTAASVRKSLGYEPGNLRVETRFSNEQ